MKKLERIILVDDDPFTNLYNEIILKQNNASENIIPFQKGKEAIEYLETKIDKVDLILLDINMPIMNGWQFLEHYQKLDEKKRATILVVMLTSSVNIADQKKAEKLQLVKKFINKPLNEEGVNEIINLFEQLTANKECSIFNRCN